uniref:Uncharacterized protein n=1 Tax=Firmicutes phage HS17 TaxID=3056395 RepID=A0AA49X449_9VIRU|nr:MAG: hypothetical protein [Firmicutes phage HS17]
MSCNHFLSHCVELIILPVFGSVNSFSVVFFFFYYFFVVFFT